MEEENKEYRWETGYEKVKAQSVRFFGVLFK